MQEQNAARARLGSITGPNVNGVAQDQFLQMHRSFVRTKEVHESKELFADSRRHSDAALLLRNGRGLKERELTLTPR